MPSFDQSFSCSSPILVLPPQPPPQPSLNTDSSRLTFTTPFVSGTKASPPTSSWPNLTPATSTPPPAAGRKRSRDEAALCDEEYFPIQAPSSQAQPENEEEWEYGEGMMLIKPGGSGYIISAGSQTGTWAEERAEEQAAAAAPSPERPVLRATKSQRLDLTATPSIAEEVSSNGKLVVPSSGSPNGTNGNSRPEPPVDDFTRHLGIGWSSLSADEDIQAAARGWTKFIENHFPITDAKIRLQSKGLASYLVEANEGYFLFGEDLRQGRLVSTSLEQTWVNLLCPVPVFDGNLVMEAGETPKSNGVMLPIVSGDHAREAAMNGIKRGDANGLDISSQTVEVEMDMS